MEEKFEFPVETVIRQSRRHQEIVVWTGYRVDLAPLRSRQATLVYEGDRVIDMELDGGLSGHQKMVRKWLEELFGAEDV